MTTDSRPNHVFQSLWVGERLSPLEQLCIKSFLAHGHRFVLYVYDEVENVPPGCEIEDARTILPEESVFLQDSGIHVRTAAAFSDRFRYELLHVRGGWWADTDALCLRADIPDSPYVFAIEDEDEQLYVGGILKAPPESDLLREAIRRSAQAGNDLAHCEIGPTLLTELVRELDLESRAWKREELYPLGWGEVLEFLDPAQADRIEAQVASSTFLHFYASMLKVANVLRDIKPPESSYLDRRYVEYEVEFAVDRRYEWSELQPQYGFQQGQRWLESEIERVNDEARRLADEHQRTAARLQERLAARELELETLGRELATVTSENLRIQQSVTIQLFRKLSEGVYSLLGRRSMPGRVLQAMLRVIGRIFGLSGAPDHPALIGSPRAGRRR